MEDWLKCQISSLVKYRQNQIVYGVTFISHVSIPDDQVEIMFVFYIYYIVKLVYSYM